MPKISSIRLAVSIQYRLMMDGHGVTLMLIKLLFLCLAISILCPFSHNLFPNSELCHYNDVMPLQFAVTVY